MDKEVLHSCKPSCSAALNCGGGMNRILLKAFGDSVCQNLSRLICDTKACEILRSLCSLRMTEGRHSEALAEESKLLCHSEASDMPCAKNVCVQNLTHFMCNQKSGKILNQVQDDTASKNNISTPLRRERAG